MAKITYKEGVEPLSGIYAGIIYKSYDNGRTTAFVQPLPSAEDAAKNPALRADRIIKLCVSDIQTQMHNPHEACKQYTNITHRVRRLYGQLCELEKSPELFNAVRAHLKCAERELKKAAKAQQKEETSYGKDNVQRRR